MQLTATEKDADLSCLTTKVTEVLDKGTVATEHSTAILVARHPMLSNQMNRARFTDFWP
jgi:hypothetical protein